MQIGIDIDGVINDLARFHIECGTKFCYEHRIDCKIDPSAYELRDIYTWSEAEYHQFQKEYYKDFFLTDLYMRSFSREIICRLKRKHKIHIITARKPRLAFLLGLHQEMTTAEISMQWLKKFKIPYDHFCLTEWDKQEVLRSGHIDIMIEDSPHFFSQAAIPCPNLICFDTSYNRAIPGGSHFRAYSWYDILHIIEKIEKGNSL